MYLPSGFSLTGQMASATGTTQPVWHVFYRAVPAQTKDDYQELRGQIARGIFDDTNVVTLLDGPTAGPGQAAVIDIEQVIISNRSADTEIFSLSTTDGTTSRRLPNVTLLSLQSAIYIRDSVWQIFGP